jgi:hypothetical protein
MIQGGLRVGIRSTLGTDHDADSLKLSIPQPQFLRKRYGKRDVILDKGKNPTKLCLTELFRVVKFLKCEKNYNPVRNFFLNLMG